MNLLDRRRRKHDLQVPMGTAHADGDERLDAAYRRAHLALSDEKDRVARPDGQPQRERSKT